MPSALSEASRARIHTIRQQISRITRIALQDMKRQKRVIRDFSYVIWGLVKEHKKIDVQIDGD